jgi:amino acid efflux transporter
MQRTLSLPHGIGLALGSIAGSGLLFLPSLTLVVGGGDVMLVWLAATVVCLPVLFLLADVVREFDDGSGIEGLIARGLGPHVAAGVPVLFLSIVMLGIPAGALIAGNYLAEAVGAGQAVEHLTALVIIGVAAGVNLAGIRVGARVQLVTAALLIAIGVALVALTSPDAAGGYGAVAPGPPDASRLLSGVLVAFFAYAGFENLTFIAGEFRNPRRDFPIAMAAAFAFYGLLAIALTANLAALVPAGRVDDVAGLSQLAGTIEPAALATGVITALALALMQVNANSWLWGMSRLVRSAADAGRLPRSLAALDRRGGAAAGRRAAERRVPGHARPGSVRRRAGDRPARHRERRLRRALPAGGARVLSACPRPSTSGPGGSAARRARRVARKRRALRATRARRDRAERGGLARPGAALQQPHNEQDYQRDPDPGAGDAEGRAVLSPEARVSPRRRIAALGRLTRPVVVVPGAHCPRMVA